MKLFTFFRRKWHYGFTLIELLLVIGIIAILASIVIVAINPTKQLGEARDAQRQSDVNTIINAIYQYAIDNNGALPDNLGDITVGVARPVCRGDWDAECEGLSVDTEVTLTHLTGSYLVNIPIDPQATTGTGTNYTIQRNANNRLTVCAPGTEQAASTICVER